MDQPKVKVQLLSKTEDALNVIYSACRQCYFEGFVGDKYPFPEIKEEEKIKLIKHVLNSGHHSTLEHVSLTVGIAGISRALTHQLVRHRIASYSHQSQRYAGAGESTNEGTLSYIIPPKISRNEKAKEIFVSTMGAIDEAYRKLIELGIPNEDSRFVLPNAAETRIVVTMNLRSWIHFLEERCCTRAQWEIRHTSNEVLALCQKEFPYVFSHLGPKCVRLGYCPEVKNGCGRFKQKSEVVAAL